MATHIPNLVIGPLNSSNYPHAMPYHKHGTLTGKRTRPSYPQFFPSQEPVDSGQFVNARRIYSRTVAPRGGAMQPLPEKKRMGAGDASQYLARIKSVAVGKIPSHSAHPVNYSSKTIDPSRTKSSLSRVRSGGTVAPAKKGSIFNPSMRIGRNYGAMNRI